MLLWWWTLGAAVIVFLQTVFYPVYRVSDQARRLSPAV